MRRTRGVLEGPRWAQVETALKDAAWTLGLDIKTDVTKHIIRETVRFEVVGENDKVETFLRGLNETIEEHNK